MTDFYVMTVDDRSDFCKYLVKRIPGLHVIKDTKRDAMATFLAMMKAAGNSPGVFMEDDIILTNNFESKIEKAIAKNPKTVIQFFSMRKADLTVGTRGDRNYLMNQCFYLPANYAKSILEFFPVWWEKNKIKNPTGNDTLVGDFLRSRREEYLIHVPSLVDHRVTKSLINPRRSTKRQSLTFTDPWE